MSIQSLTRLSLVLGALAVLPLALSACDDMYGDDHVVVDGAMPQGMPEPPPPYIQAEFIPVIPDPQAEIWRPGYWAMSKHRFVWVPGEVIPRPSPTAVWDPARWVQHNYGWSFQQGHWE